MKNRNFILLVLLFVMTIAILYQPQQEIPEHKKELPEYMKDTVKWNKFLECSENLGDAGCDSCFYAVFGYYVEDAGYSNYTPIEE